MHNELVRRRWSIAVLVIGIVITALGVLEPDESLDSRTIAGVLIVVVAVYLRSIVKKERFWAAILAMLAGAYIAAEPSGVLSLLITSVPAYLYIFQYEKAALGIQLGTIWFTAVLAFFAVSLAYGLAVALRGTSR